MKRRGIRGRIAGWSSGSGVATGGVSSLGALTVALVLAAVISAGCGQAEEGGSEGQGGSGESGGETTEAQSGGSEEAAEGGSGDPLVVYSGRSAELVGPIIDTYIEESGNEVQVRYGDTAELAATLLEEGENSPADVYFAQDAGALGAVADEDLLVQLPEEILSPVEERLSSQEGEWVGISGRARVIAYNTDNLTEEDLPESILDFTDPEWEGRIGWAPTNGSFQAFVTALRELEGEDAAREWLEGIQANNPTVYEDNTTTLEGVAAGEVDVGFVNHYYLFRALEEQGEDFSARNYYPTGGDPGALVNVAGAGILASSDNKQAAEDFLSYMVSEEAQQYFADETYEYPVIEGVETNEELVPLEEIESPDIDLSNLDDLEGTLELLRETGVL
ncbi:iron ABC transporter substrate-binding protein [Rubrobacter radiotolerans]|uniref:Iron ABC transporter substrate-binding protein n=1 Tax=Rubrobacter radiotolerans TaxID=42256 RepID=A0AB35T4Y9_RUBRA|nr:iron ABC transporter substrate-binding protein [Rubrobacter radiotolerans]MDX5893855.1 iron ABC transporter substrate-binding protein [Rubrobacter radiotolerans]SMC04627.1 iron(III) transport system substrate-binding protein [Rubrobacter radiotolerans DSM 5868]